MMAMGAGSMMGTKFYTACQHFDHQGRPVIAPQYASCSAARAADRWHNQPPTSNGLQSPGFIRVSERINFSRGDCIASKQFGTLCARAVGKNSIVSTERDERDRKLPEQNHEIRICINKTCRKSGSLETFEVFRSLAPPNVTVESCGCIGKCGAGPNLVILPAEMMVSHCNTPAHAARLLALQCGADNPDNNLKALALKQQANKAFELGKHVEAEQLYTEAIELNPSGGLHFIFANRSALRLAQGNYQAALEDAKEAQRFAPEWAQALVRQADALSSMGEVRPALATLTAALRLDPSLRRSKGFQSKSRALESKLAKVGASA